MALVMIAVARPNTVEKMYAVILTSYTSAISVRTKSLLIAVIFCVIVVLVYKTGR